MRCIVRSADRMLYDQDTQRIVARSHHGEFALMANHAPILAVLESGLIRLQTSDGEVKLVSKGGTLEFADDQATLLVEQPFLLDEIDVASLRQQLQTSSAEAEGEVLPPEEIAYLELLCQIKESHD